MSELSERKPSANQGSGKEGSAAGVVRGFDAVGGVLNTLQPYVEKAWAAGEKAWTVLAPYHPEEFLPAILGLILAFFGGHFMTTIAAVEAFKMIGGDHTYKCLLILYDNYKVVLAESKKDDKVDADHDGIADVKQISAKELASRKFALALKSCDPMQVSDALAGVNAGIIGVLATLRVQFARAITLGAIIGGVFTGIAERFLRPVLEKVIPVDYHKWITPLIGYACKAIAITIAWFIQRVISAFHSAVRGGQMFAKGLSGWLVRSQYIKENIDEKDPIFMGIAMSIAFVGFMWQLSSWFSLPFPLNLLLLPFTMVESVITYVAADKSMFSAAN